MERFLLESAIRATLVAAGTALVISTTRIRTPAVLHGLWTGVLVTMLVLPLLTIWGPDARVAVLPSAPPALVTPTVSAFASPTPGVASMSGTPLAVGRASIPLQRRWSWSDAAFWFYLVVAGALFARLVLGTLRGRRLVRLSVVKAGRLTSAACASPVTVGWLRPVVILPDTWRDWPQPKLDAVLIHEHEHARRRHTLVQWLALLNRAVFWFHPLSWWLAHRLAALAEETCDDAVVAGGHDPHDYSDYLIETAHAVAGRGRVRFAGAFMPGAFLPHRITRLLTAPLDAGTSRARIVGAGVACALAAVVSIVATPVRAASQLSALAGRLVIRPVQPRWIPPESSQPQPVSLEWLEGDEWAFQVQSIITNEELTAYSRLQTAQQRDAFIARFWAERDPSPATPSNEFRDEYMRRLEYAGKQFESGGAGFGFDTDRGRIYLMLGAPDGIEIEGRLATSTEIWRYASVAGGGDLRVRFLLRDTYCGHRIASPAPVRAIKTVAMYPLGLTSISIPVDPSRVVGVRYELRNGAGVSMDEGQLGALDDTAAKPFSEQLPPGWLDHGFGCTHALPPGEYSLSTAIRFVTGRIERDTVAFSVE